MLYQGESEHRCTDARITNDTQTLTRHDTDWTRALCKTEDQVIFSTSQIKDRSATLAPSRDPRGPTRYWLAAKGVDGTQARCHRQMWPAGCSAAHGRAPAWTTRHGRSSLPAPLSPPFRALACPQRSRARTLQRGRCEGISEPSGGGQCRAGHPSLHGVSAPAPREPWTER